MRSNRGNIRANNAPMLQQQIANEAGNERKYNLCIDASQSAQCNYIVQP